MADTIDTEKRRDPPKNADRSDNIPNPQFDKPKEVDAGDRTKGDIDEKTGSGGPKRVDGKKDDDGSTRHKDDRDKRAHDEDRDDPVGVDTRHQTVSPSAAEH